MGLPTNRRPRPMTKLEFALNVPVFAVLIYVVGKVLGVL